MPAPTTRTSTSAGSRFGFWSGAGWGDVMSRRGDGPVMGGSRSTGLHIMCPRTTDADCTDRLVYLVDRCPPGARGGSLDGCPDDADHAAKAGAPADDDASARRDS